MKENSLQQLCTALEPMLRRVINEEIVRGLQRNSKILSRSPSLRIQALEHSGLQLIFTKKIKQHIFTSTKLGEGDNAPFQVLLVDMRSGQMIPTSLPHPIKVEIVVLDGDFPPSDVDNWSSEDFDRNIVKERTGRRPLVTGDLNVTIRDGSALIGDLEFTDNSSWVRSRTFRLGARVARGSCHGVRIREAITEAFVVKDHRGELYKKHYPPMLEDDVWRLVKIGKDGAFHKKLSSHGINTVQDFLKLYVIDQDKLRSILGLGMSERMWESLVNHASTCNLGSKFYVFQEHDTTLILNPKCQVVRASINGQEYTMRDLNPMNKTYIQSLAEQAYNNWKSLPEIDETLLNETALLTQGIYIYYKAAVKNLVGEMIDHPQTMAISYHQQAYLTDDCDGSIHGGSMLTSNVHLECGDWQMTNPGCHSNATNENGLFFSKSSSDGDLNT
ncbi:Calmodulin binding protein-like, N-terminal domain [Dillenia turbinata]|uniref:Calmodulin binding protein-like, N-terminal domain n=1 Tax=Dillenia turbinata TaxID=194707 RepID=A0AAN8USI3_9MAGN